MAGKLEGPMLASFLVLLAELIVLAVFWQRDARARRARLRPTLRARA